VTNSLLCYLKGAAVAIPTAVVIPTFNRDQAELAGKDNPGRKA
jgi:hypothetical protein